jgi:predicted NAD/FAD-binding protein
LGEIKLNLGIKSSKEKNGKIILTDDENKEYEFDKVIFASHADQTYNIIADKTDLEEEILSNIKYSKNLAILHKNQEQMPKSKKAWASWVYLSSKKQSKVALSYYMNNLQNIDSNYPLFVTLNPIEKIPKKDIFLEVNYEHPIFDLKAIEAQEDLQKIQGKRNIYFAGAWNKYGFHEDGLLSAVNIVKSLGVKIPW